MKRTLNSLIRALEVANNKDDIIICLQQINHFIISSKLYLNESDFIQIKWVEAYFCNCNNSFCDVYMHKKEKQKGVDNFCKLYFHEIGRGGVDLCLSKGDYYLSFLLKWITKDGIEYKQIDAKNILEQYKDSELTLKDYNEHICFDTVRKGLTAKDSDYLGLRFAKLASFDSIKGKIPYLTKDYGKEKILKEYLANQCREEKEKRCKELLGYKSSFVIGD